MEQFSDIFTLPDSPNPEYNPRENVLNQIRNMDAASEAERRQARTRHFINQLNDAETGNVSIIHENQDAQGTFSEKGLLRHHLSQDKIQQSHIVNEYNSFNLANITPPIAPKWKQPDNLLDEFRKFKHSCMRIFNGPMCYITSGKVKTIMLLTWAVPDSEDI